jgi:hypothetical protein
MQRMEWVRWRGKVKSPNLEKKGLPSKRDGLELKGDSKAVGLKGDKCW